MTIDTDGITHDPACFAGRHVLIVEDETVVAMVYESLLGELGCTVLGPVAGVDEAHGLLDPGAGALPEVAVLDLELGGEPSGAVVDALALRGIPFVVVTGYAVLAETVGDAVRTAPRLVKPAAFDDVARLLAALIC